jgi:hypothetical protein
MNRIFNHSAIRFAVALLAACPSMATASGPSTISGLQLWLKADAGVTADANGVSAWNDQSGLGNSVTQSNNNRKPVLISNAFGNGLPALRFANNANNVLDDRLDGPAVITGSEARSVFIVARQDIATADNVSMITLNRDNTGDRTIYRITPESGVRMENADTLFANHPIGQQFRILTLQNPAGAMSNNTEALLDGIKIKSSSVNSPGLSLSTGTGGFRIGDSENETGAAFSGDIAEIIVYNRDLSAAETNAVGYYLESKYGLKTSHIPEAMHTGKVQVWLMGGQSNMRGHGNPAEVTDSRYQSPQGDVMLWHNQHNEDVFFDEGDGRDITGVGPQSFGFEQLTWGGGRTETTQEGGFGPELSFGRAVADVLPDQRIALIKHAIGGTNLYSDWNATTNGGEYLDFVETTHAALQVLTDAGLDYEIKGMLWMQGEADSSASASAVYQTNLEALIAAVRQEFVVPTMPFVMGLTYSSSMVRAAQLAVAAGDPLVSAVDLSDLAASGLVTYDNIHLNTASQLEFGRRLAVAAGYTAPSPPPPQPPGQITFVSAVEGSSGNTYKTGSSLADVSWVGSGDTQWATNNQVQATNGIRYIGASTSAPAPVELTTEITGLADGTYDIYVFFWDNILTTNANNWTVSAKLDGGAYQSYSSTHADAVSGTTKVGVSAASSLSYTNSTLPAFTYSNTQQLFVAKIGQSVVSGGSTVSVFIDNFIDNGGASDNRTIYDGVGYELTSTFANWISNPDYGLDPSDQGLDADPDGDGIDSGIENLFGTNPGAFSHGLIVGTTDPDAGTFTFTHPQNATPASDLSASYRWSTDLAAFHLGGATSGGTTVNFTTEADTPSPGFTRVTATATGTLPARLFVDVKVTGP